MTIADSAKPWTKSAIFTHNENDIVVTQEYVVHLFQGPATSIRIEQKDDHREDKVQYEEDYIRLPTNI